MKPDDSKIGEIVFGAFVVLVFVVFILGAIFFTFELIATETENTFTATDQAVMMCLATERYTREECIQLVGEGNK